MPVFYPVHETLQWEDLTCHRPSLMVKGRAHGTDSPQGLQTWSTFYLECCFLRSLCDCSPHTIQVSVKYTLLREFSLINRHCLSHFHVSFLHSTCYYLILFCWLICLLDTRGLNGNAFRAGTLSVLVMSVSSGFRTGMVKSVSQQFCNACVNLYCWQKVIATNSVPRGVSNLGFRERGDSTQFQIAQ